jgi:dihydropteroate synthase
LAIVYFWAEGLKPTKNLHLSAKDNFFYPRQWLNLGGKLLDVSSPKIMGIINLTPDSFHAASRQTTAQDALAQAQKMVAEGADILDLGACSTRPGAPLISTKEEWQRLGPALATIRKNLPNVVISVDTFTSEIAKNAVAEGAQIINDISAGSLDAQLFETIAELNVPYILMHMQGTPQTMQQNPTYSNVVAEVMTFFSEKLALLRALGVNDVLLDPGFGFGKNLQHNFELLKQLRDFKLFELPILAGVSRKSMINKALGTSPENALNGTTALHAFALERGANILRVHDVAEAKQVVTLHHHLHATWNP